ncbi:hypothetical protein [Streptomyces sp. CB03911]|uniref:hypothetical protein n=1 Tax=Streptomyces sp. CB03911 TaxID=1804758 RepID=UPI00093C5D7C|nr:hypothetical protein [Streptomyces sp. CB03911]OKI16614.1 hypothetical protein A6A07_11440 [Streptomyces sp. CB03911]
MSEPYAPFPGSVELSATVEVNGRRYQARTQAPLQDWQRDEQYQEWLKADLLRSLGEGIVKGLAPEVMVTLPGPTLQEALTDALRPFDYPTEY